MATLSPVESIYEKLMEDIISGRLKAGQRLPTTALAEKFGTSRMPVRQALQRLVNEGIVVQSPGFGARLVSPSPKEVRDVYVVRVILETTALSMAFRNLGSVQLARLEESLLKQCEARNRSFAEYLKWDFEFHRIIAEASDNDFLEREIENALSASNVYRILFEKKGGDYKPPAPEKEHHEILFFIKCGDQKRAGELLRRHILRGVEDLGMGESQTTEEVMANATVVGDGKTWTQA